MSRRVKSRQIPAVGLVAALLIVLLWLIAASAGAETASPGWQATVRTLPTYLRPGGTGVIQIDVYDVGAATSSGGATVTDVLPKGLTATGPAGVGGKCSGTRIVICQVPSAEEIFLNSPKSEYTYGEEFRGGYYPVSFGVRVDADAVGTEINRVTVAGGGAPTPAAIADRVTFGSSSPGFGFADFDGWFSNANGTIDTQAGSHPYDLTFSFDLNTAATLREEGEEKFELTGGEARNIELSFPRGFVGDPNAAPQCSREQFDDELCPASTQVGIDTFAFTGESEKGHYFGEEGYIFTRPIYNLVPSAGAPALFGFEVAGNQVFLESKVRSGGDYGITVHVENLPQNRTIAFNSATIWGVPAAATHDSERRGEECFAGGCTSGAVPKPLLTLPTSCEGPQTFTAGVDTWENASTSEASFLSHDAEGEPTGLTGCDGLGFGPFISVSPDTTHADTPAGLTTDVKVPQEGLLARGGVSESNIKNATVVLPEGVVISPARAAGLALCPLARDGVGAEGPPSCPSASQVGTAQVTTPVLTEPIEGEVYVLESNPPHIKLLVALAGEGVEIKLVGNVSLNEATGQLTTTFENTPELPFTDFKLSFSGGPQAALATPTECGLYTSTSDFSPWSSPFVPDVFPSSEFAIEGGPDGSGCVSPLPFSPSMIAGATTDQAGGYTNFSLLLSRADGQQRISKLQFKTPTGLLGMISHVSLCEEPQAAKGECAASSRIGHTVVGAGPGPYPLYVPEEGEPEAPIYIGGPYGGAPYSLIIAVPVIAGPFNLGTTVVRGKIEVDPQTSQLTITTDPLPRILDGVPVDMRTINAVIDRKEFMFNPTNCDPQSFSGTATSIEGATAALSSSFQVGSCRSLTFDPTFRVSTSARTSRTEGASLRVTLTLPDEGGLSSIANVQRVRVSLPKQLPTPLKTLQKACTERVFAEDPKSCPTASQVGQVKVSTPVLPGGLSGTAYFVSHGGARYPELILVLTGENGVTVQVHGETQISKAGITTATFSTVPDVPFSSFELTLPQREFPALTANGNLCKAKSLIMPTEMAGQNGLVLHQSTKIAVTGCPKSKKASHARKKKGKRGHAEPKHASKKKG